MGKVKNLCDGCVRYHPKGVGNCVLANAWMRLSSQHKYTLVVTDCPLFLSPKVVFAAPEPKEVDSEAVVEDEEEEV